MPIDLNSLTPEQKTAIKSALGLADTITAGDPATLTNKTLVNPVFSGAGATGQLELPAQKMSTDTSAVTRGALIAEMSENFLTPIAWNTPVSNDDPNMTGTSSGISCTLNSGAVGTMTRTAGKHVYVTAYDNPQNNPGSGGNPRLASSKFSLLFDLHANAMQNNEYRFLYGVATGKVALDAAGIAIIWTSSTSVKLQYHNGTALQESSSFIIPALDISRPFNRYMLTWNGSKMVLYNKNWTITQEQPRWSLVGEYTPTGSIPNSTSGTNMVFANVNTATMSTGSGINVSLRVRSAYMAPYVITPNPL